MVGRINNEGFLKLRTDELLKETLDGDRTWKKEADKRMSTTYRVIAPEDWENYNVRISIMKIGSNRNSRFVLASYERGLFADIYKLRSKKYKPLAQLGEIIFSN